MLEVLVWARTDGEVKNACVEMLNHLGVPFRMIENFEVLGKGKGLEAVLILPESSSLSSTEMDLLWELPCSMVFVGFLPRIIWKDFGAHLLGVGGWLPPKISGLLKADGIETVPFFYDFPVLEFNPDLVENHAEIEVGETKHVGVGMSKRNTRPFAIIVPQIFRSSAYLLRGAEESLTPSDKEHAGLVDRFGRIDGRKTEIVKCGFFRVPIINVYEKLLLQLLLEFSRQKEVPLVRKSLFPKPYDAALCVMHEVDYVISAEAGIDAVKSFLTGKFVDAFAKGFLAMIAGVSTLLADFRLTTSRQTLRFIPSFLSQKLIRFNPVWNFDMFLDIEREFNVVSSFYFLANKDLEDSDYDFRHPQIFETLDEIRKKGCEVGLHASFNSYNKSGTLAEEKRALEKALGARVLGVRQHFYRFEAPKTWRHQEDAGFIYDSSFGHAQQVGFKAGTCLPYKPFDSEREKSFSILEVPPIITDGALLQDQYMRLSHGEALRICQSLIDITLQYNGVLTLNWHVSFDRERREDWFILYREILRYCSRFNFWKTRTIDIVRWLDTLRETSLYRLPSSENVLAVGIDSPSSTKGFGLRIFLPSPKRVQKILFNNMPINSRQDGKSKTLDISIDLQKGENNVTILFSGSRKNDKAPSPRSQ